MAKHDFQYFLHEGISNMFSHGFMSFAAIGITVACLLIMGTFSLVAVNADAQLADLEQENDRLRKRIRTYEDVIFRNNLWSYFSKRIRENIKKEDGFLSENTRG